MCDRLYCLTLGSERVPRGMSLDGGGDQLFDAPVIAVVVRSEGGWFLLETGLSVGVRDAPQDYREIYLWGDPSVTGITDPLIDALALCGLITTDIQGVAVSHLHVDHTGGLRHFAAGPPIFVQQEELDFGFSTAGVKEAYWRPDYERRNLRWHPLEGDALIAPGIQAVFTPGHTPGHMSYLVEMKESGKWLFAVDAIDLVDNLELDCPIGTSARAADNPLRRRSHDRLVVAASELGARLIPGHCPRTWPSLSSPPNYYT